MALMLNNRQTTARVVADNDLLMLDDIIVCICLRYFAYVVYGLFIGQLIDDFSENKK